MSPCTDPTERALWGPPRASGDEPNAALTSATATGSAPRERG